jgi:membrane protein required for colicin V production
LHAVLVSAGPLQGASHIHRNAWRRCTFSEWNDHSSSARLALRRAERAMHPCSTEVSRVTAIDWIALAILAGSLIIGLLRGFVREAFSLAAWVVAFLAARIFSPTLAGLIPGIEQEGLRQAAAIVLIFVGVLVLAHLLAAMLAGLLKLAGLGGLDRGLGLLFGVVRGLVVLVVLTLAAGLTALPRSDAWRGSLVHGPLEIAALKFIPWLPEDLAALIRFA